MSGWPLGAEFQSLVLARLGLAPWTPQPAEPTFDALTALYAAWCQRVPFDNVRKLIAVRSGAVGPLPGDSGSDFFAAWLRWGTGGTCWAGNGALRDLLVSLGFDARCAIATMTVRENATPNHGTVIVHLGGERYVVDASILHSAPLRLDARDETSVSQPAWGVHCRPHDGAWRIRWRPLHTSTGLDCQLNEFDVPRHVFHDLHERSRNWSPFNYELTVRINRGDEVIGASFGDYVRFDRAGGVHKHTISQADRSWLLQHQLQFSAEIVDELPDDVPTPPPP